MTSPMVSGSSPLPAAQDEPSPRPRRTILRLKMSSRREAIAPTVERVVAEVASAVPNADQRANLAVALSEALSNAVVHGNRQRADTAVLVVVCVDADGVVVVDVHDSGPGFDVAAVNDCREGERILAPSGRGIFLMRSLVDRVEFNSRGNRVRLSLKARKPDRT
jgi:serine/threonine-protein kinase RsbW